MKNLLLATSILAASGMALSGCQSVSERLAVGNPLNQPVMKSSIMTVDGSNREVGQLFLRPVDEGVQVYGKLTTLKPGATVALHIHETGSCKEGGKAAGGHFNPTNQPHGHPDSDNSHAGDMPNITANENGIATVNYINKDISVAMAGPTSVYRRAFIVHAGEDDYTSQPAGDSGDRIACGIIEKN